MKSVKIMLLGIAILLLGIACGVSATTGGGDTFEVFMIILVPIGFIITIAGFLKKDKN